MVWCISVRSVAIRSLPPVLRRNAVLQPPLLVVGLGERPTGSPRSCPAAKAAAAVPARAPKTSSSVSEFEPSRLAPLMLTQAPSPAAYRPGSGVAPWMSVRTPPIM